MNEIPPELQDTVDLGVQEVLLAASQHDISRLRALLREDEHLVNAQDTETGFSALHSAIAACEDESDGSQGAGTARTNGHMNGDANGVAENGVLPEPSEASALDKAKATVQWLLQNGAIWNQIDANDETPGCIAYRLGLDELYRIMVDAGTRAELLLSRLEEYQELADEDMEEGEGVGDDGDRNERMDASAEKGEGERPASIRELVVLDEDPAASNEAFLRSELTFQPSALLDRDANGVMMEWETEIMQKTAELLMPSEGLRVLNIGHGMGIIDSILQSKKPAAHHIIEAHSNVIEQLKAQGWMDRPNVHIHEGRWQDVVPKLIEEGLQFDALFYDTFAEDYKAFKILFEEHLIGLLDDSARWSFFNGLGADRQISYDVYRNIVSMELQEAGYEIDWTTLAVPDLASQGVWEGTKRPYWTLKQYHLPVCSFFA